MKVLVVGAAGFLGSHAAARFAGEGHAVTGLVRSRARAAGVRRLAGVALAEGSVEAPPALEPHDAVFYAPGTWRIGETVSPEEAVRRCRVVYVEGVRRIAGLAADWGATFTFMSGVTAHGKVDHPEPIVEDAPPRSLCVYGRHKREGEGILAELASSRALRWTALRPHEVYGDGDPGSPLLHVYDRVSRGRFFHIGDGENRWSICNVANLAAAAVHFAKTPAAAPVLVADEAPHSWNEIAAAVADALGKRRRFLHVPVPVARLVLPRRWVEYRTARMVFDCTRARSLGFLPEATLEDGVARGIGSWRKR